jgi:uncharacterized Zn finger protein (UPF0148 family)
MNKCPKCGNKLSPVDVLCPRCGALVEVIHVAPHPDAVPSENTDAEMHYQPESADPYEQSGLPITKQPREAVNLPQEDDMPVSQQTQEVCDTIEEDDMPMSRQARKAAMRAGRTKAAPPFEAQESKNIEERKTK